MEPGLQEGSKCQMTKWIAILILVPALLLACGSDAQPASPTAGASSADSPTATPAAEAQDTARTSLDDYLLAVCDGQEEFADWEEGASLRELSSGLGQHIEIMESLDPPLEVSDWHDAGLAFQRAFQETVDDYLEDSQGLSEDEFIFSMFLTLAPHFQPIEQATAAMDPGVRSRMIEAGCIDQETSGAVPAQEERVEIRVGDTLADSLDNPNETDLFQFQAEAGVDYVIEVAWQDMPQITVAIKDSSTPLAFTSRTIWAETSPLVVRWAAEESKTHYIDVFSEEGTGAYTLSVSIDTSPDSPSSVSAAWEGSAIRVSWDPVEGAEYYNVYYDRGGYFCNLDHEGNPSSCEELGSNVVDTSYTHASPNSLLPNHYWVVACSREGCSAVDSANPTTPGERSALPSPANQRYEILGNGSQARITWDAVDGADFYYVYHSNQRSCSVDGSGPASCEELGRETGTMAFHSRPDPVENYYWVVACTLLNGCSQIDSDNPARPE